MRSSVYTISIIMILTTLAGCLDGIRDSDGDEIDNDQDNCKDVSNPDQINYDGDLFGNDCDLDDDNDGVVDESDLCPYGNRDWVSDISNDFDSDGCLDSTEDDDDDNDGTIDTEDAFPTDSNETSDSDDDDTGDNADAFPLDPSETDDSDSDGVGDNADKDDDNDGVEDTEDAYPLDPSEQFDFDGDGIGDNADTDDDNDGFLDENDWYDRGDGEILLEFTRFQIWSETIYDDDDGDGIQNTENPDVYAYVGIGNCEDSMEYNDYWDNINADAYWLEDWYSLAWDIPENLQRLCFYVSVYDDDPGLGVYDEMLDFIPGAGSHAEIEFDLSTGVLSDSGEGVALWEYDNRGENSLSIKLFYQFSTMNVT